jgi:hypothetical protein
MTDHEDRAPATGDATGDATRDTTVSRRRILTAGLAAAGAGLAGSTDAAAAPGVGPGSHLVGVAQAGSTAVEFRARFAQTGSTGEQFTAYGYLTTVHGATDDDLFAGAAHDETTALFTAYATGALVRRFHDQSVHAIDIEGELTIYQRLSPGASFADPASFQVGTVVARFAMTLQDVLTVIAPAKGIPTLNGDMRQTLAKHLLGSGPARTFGHREARARFFATGLGTLIDPVQVNSQLEMAGHWTTK